MSTPTLASPDTAQRNVEIKDPLQQDISKLANAVRQDPTQQDIVNLAYGIWQERGCPLGSAEQDWFEAERRLQAGSAKSLTPSQ
jgi:hypothetical protein